jgi:hypothetical protein
MHTDRRRNTSLHDGFACLAALILLPLALPSDARAETRNEGALWLVNQIEMPIDDRFGVHLMVQNRWVDDVDSYERTVVRPWLSFAWTERIELSLGYDAHDFQNPTDMLENRAWQRIAYRHPVGPASLFTHFWLEERVFDDSDSIAWRGRFQIGGTLPLPADFDWTLRNEFFFNLNDTPVIKRTGLRENHLFTGFRYPLGRFVRVEAGYLLQYRDTGGVDLFDHTFVVGLSARTRALTDLF